MSEDKEDIGLKSEELFKVMNDPVRWAAHHLSSSPRWYQEQILRHPHNRKVLRCGRRIGKCIEENQRMLLSTGEYVKVKDMYKRENKGKSISLGEKPKIVESDIYSVEDNGFKPCYQILTKSGKSILLTENHPLLTPEGWEEVQNLREGQFIGTPKELSVFGSNDSRSDSFIRLLAYLLTSANVSERMVTVSLKNKEVSSDLFHLCEEFNLTLLKKSNGNYFIIDKEKNNELLYILRHKKDSIPEEVYSYTKEKLAVFLRAVYDSQGWTSVLSTCEIGFGNKDIEFLHSLSHLLLRFGIRAFIQKRRISRSAFSYQMMIYRYVDISKFYAEIGKDGIRDYTSVHDLAISRKELSGVHPKNSVYFNELARLGVKDRYPKTKSITIENLALLAKKHNSEVLKELAESDIFYEEIKSIEAVGERQTYDVFVPDTQNLLVEDLFVHNTWTMVAHMLWVAFTCNQGKNPNGATCVVATPYDTQARLIFDELVKSIEGSDILSQSLATKTKNPYYIKFKNGSEIKLFTAGTKSGAEGGSLRGQKADWLYMDIITLSLHIVRYVE